MDPERRSLIVTAAVGLLVLAIIIGSIYYLVKFIQNRQSSQPTQVSNSQQTRTPSASASGTSLPQTAGRTPAPSATSNINVKIYNGGIFQLAYPKNWGLLSCSNSKNIELDPTNAADTNIACDVAQKPVTILLANNLKCQGETVTLGGNQVVRNSQGNKGGGEVDYRWCVINPNGVDLDITHRVSQSGSRATSKQDFAQDVEQMVSQIHFTQGS